MSDFGIGNFDSLELDWNEYLRAFLKHTFILLNVQFIDGYDKCNVLSTSGHS